MGRYTLTALTCSVHGPSTRVYKIFSIVPPENFFLPPSKSWLASDVVTLNRLSGPPTFQMLAPPTGLGFKSSVSVSKVRSRLTSPAKQPQPALESRNTVTASRSESGSINIHAIYFFFFLLLVLLLVFLLRLLLNLLLLLLLPTWAH